MKSSKSNESTQLMIPLAIKKEWYEGLIEDCKAILTERVFNARQEKITMAHELGSIILKNQLNFKRAGYGKKVIETVAGDLGLSRTELYYCIEFAKKYKTLSMFMDNCLEGKNISWNKLKTGYLPEAKIEKKVTVEEPAGNDESDEGLETTDPYDKQLIGIVRTWLDKTTVYTEANIRKLINKIKQVKK